ncbi:MAG: tRNA (guanosine(46)-N7)-methyltransferase TrmB [Hyphomicrobiaceae bacterium]
MTAKTRDIRSFARRRARKLSDRQSDLLSVALPRLALELNSPAPLDLSELFPTSVREVWLEIGFGGGEHLIWQASRNRDIGFIGCEPFVDGLAKVLSAIEYQALTNVRLYCDDARNVLRWLPNGTLTRVFILYPDPWPKRRHNKRRLFNATLLHLLARAMIPGGEVRLATDIGDYARTSLLAVRQSQDFFWMADRASDWRLRPTDWPITRYNQKANHQGRRSYYLTFRRRQTNGDNPRVDTKVGDCSKK